MRYTRVHMEPIAVQLAPVVVTTAELEARLAPVYAALRIPEGQLEALTGIAERRFWEPGFLPSRGAALAARKALEASGLRPDDVEVLIYAGVCRDELEPATACHVAAEIGVSPRAAVYDLGNACLGVLNGILDVANRIELGQVRAGLVVSCESAREIVDATIDRMLARRDMDLFRLSLATMTGGSGAVAVLVTDGSFGGAGRRRLVGAATRTAPEHHLLCRWQHGCMATDSVSVLKHGVDLGRRTWEDFLRALGWTADGVDKTVCHQVGSAHRSAILKALGLSPERDFATYAHLGNMGTAALPAAASIAESREFLVPGERVAFLGIGSGLNCMMLGWEW